MRDDTLSIVTTEIVSLPGGIGGDNANQCLCRMDILEWCKCSFVVENTHGIGRANGKKIFEQ